MQNHSDKRNHPTSGTDRCFFYETEEELRFLYNVLTVVHQQALDRRTLLTGAVSLIRDWAECEAVGIRLLDEKDNIPYEAYEGFSKTFYENESPLSLKTNQCVCIRVIESTTDPNLSIFTEGGSFYTNGTSKLLAETDETEKCESRNMCNEFGYESVAAVPMRDQEKTIGLIHVADPQENKLPVTKVRVLERAAILLGTAVERARLQEEQRILQFSVDHASASVFRITPEGRLVYANDAACRSLEKSRSELIDATLEGIDVNYSQNERTGTWQKLKETGMRNFETEYRKKDGSVFPVDVTSHYLCFGDIEYEFVYATDITERKQAERDLRKSNAKLQETLEELQQTRQQVIEQERQRALTTMASGIAHDFNNALSPIQGFSKMLLDNPEMLEDREKAVRYLNHIHTSASSAAETIRRMRKFYRPDEETRFTDLDLNSVITDAVSITKPRWQEEAKAAGKDIEIQTELDDIPAVSGNEAELNDMITNLIFNAVDAMLEGGRISISTCIQDEQHIGFEFSDNGTGMSEETRQKCLDPFYTEKGAEGSGLGLATVQGVVRRHNGELSIDSTEGEGTTFYITLPVAKSTAEPTEQKENHSHVLKVLAVEDEEAQRELLHDILIAEGHQVETASNGIEGIEKFNTGWFDLVITDRAMPEMNGDDLAAKVKEAAPDKPVIMLTGFGDMMDAAGENPPNVDAVVSKPMTKEKLRETIGEVVG